MSLYKTGCRESRVSDAPAASCAKQKAHELVTTGSPDQSGFPRAMVLTVSFVISPVTGLVCHRRFADIDASHPVGPETSPQNLTPASGRQDHTTSPYATTSFVCTALVAHDPKDRPAITIACRRCRVHRIPPRFRDDREPPLWGRDGAVVVLILARAEAEYFFDRGWTAI